MKAASALRVISLLCFAAAGSWAETLPNPGFEVDTDTVPPGLRSAITGWILTGTGGINTSGGVFADNGTVPEGLNVAFLQAASSLSTSLTGLTAGNVYRLSFRANIGTASGSPTAGCALNGQTVIPFTSAPSVGGTNPYYTISQDFTATGPTAELSVSNQNPAESTLLLDAFVITLLPPKISIEYPAGQPFTAGILTWGQNIPGLSTVPVAAQSGVTAISAGDAHTLALKSDNSIIALGRNNYGETTVPVTARSGVIAVAAGGSYSVALKNDGRVLAWGLNQFGQTNVPVAAQSDVEAIALKSDGSVIAWGDNASGQRTVPIAAQSGVTAIAAGTIATVALRSDGSVISWGANTYGQTTVPVGAQSGVTAIATSAYFTLALKSDGSVLAWGRNERGETVVPVAAQSGVTAIAAGRNHAVALDTPVLPVSLPLAATSPPQTFAIKNTGLVPLSITSISVTGGNAADFSLDTSTALTSVPPDGQTTFTATFTPGARGLRQTTLRISNNDPGQSVYDLTLKGTGLDPEITVRGNNLEIADGDTTPDVVDHTYFAGVPMSDGTLVRSFTISNPGNSSLLLTGTPKVAVGGEHALDFAVSLQPAPSVAASSSSTFEITFTPGAPGPRSATVSISNNDADEGTYDFAIRGYLIEPIRDLDNDGMNDYAEYLLSSLGFDFQAAQPALVEVLNTNANTAELYTQAQILSQHPGTPMLLRDSATGRFTLDLSFQKSENLGSFSPFPFVAPQMSFQPDGTLRFLFTPLDDAAFFRVVAQ